MKIFQFDPAQYREQYAAQGWVHIPNGIAPDFLARLQEFSARSLEETRLDSFAIKGKKEQSLYEFGDDLDFPEELFDAVSELCGLRRETMTLSERHIQAYDSDADPEPAAHKDRYPSQVSVGLSIEIPEASRLVLYPHDHRELNPFNTSAGLRRSLQPDELPEVALRNAQEVEIADRPGDVVMFPGSTTWHLRRRSAGAVNLYVKLNDFDCDPLGEDPATPLRRERTLALLDGGSGQDLDGRTVAVSRRMDYVSRQYMRNGEETLLATLWGEEPFGVTAMQVDLLRLADGRRPLGELADELAAAGLAPEDVMRQGLILIQRGALDLIA
jgi:hypothetical protein